MTIDEINRIIAGATLGIVSGFCFLSEGPTITIVSLCVYFGAWYVRRKSKGEI